MSFVGRSGEATSQSKALNGSAAGPGQTREKVEGSRGEKD